MKSENVHIFATALITAIFLVSVEGVLFVDDDPYNAMEGCTPRSSHITWSSVYGGIFTYDLDITEEEFRTSMYLPIKRSMGGYTQSYIDFLTPDNPHIASIAEYICGLTSDEVLRATFALNFVQCAIKYTSDDDLYNTKEHFAFPIETLYLGKGDCEDLAFLLCSIYLAMGLDSRILIESDHIGAALHLDGFWLAGGKEYDGKRYYSCYTTAAMPTGLFIPFNGTEKIGDEQKDAVYYIKKSANTGLVSLRYGLSRYLDEMGIERGAIGHLL